VVHLSIRGIARTVPDLLATATQPDAGSYMFREDALDVRFPLQEIPRRTGMSTIQLLRVELLLDGRPKP
jgi:hypothetical protein